MGERDGFHAGFDISGTNIEYTPLYSVTNGYVYTIFVNTNRNGYGIAIKTDSIDPTTGHYLIASYMHMAERPYKSNGSYWMPPTSQNSLGDRVYSGNFLGRVGGTGGTFTFGPHLHFQVCNSGHYYPDYSYQAVNPIHFFPYISFSGNTAFSSPNPNAYQTELTYDDRNTWIDIRLVDYIGEDLVTDWISSNDEYKDIVDLIIDFNIDNSTFEELAYQFNLYEIYDINEIQTEAASRR
jgi:hypothetical protein